MALTGRCDGPPRLPPGTAASVVAEGIGSLGLAPIPGLLGERAAHAGYTRNAPRSCGGAFRILPAMDGHVGLSLARPADLELVPALVEHEVTGDPWGMVSEWLTTTCARDAEARLRLLGLPGGAIPAAPPYDRPGIVTTTLAERRRAGGSPVVVDLTSLWAGPLCAHLLGLRGATVVKVESQQRPDGARFGAPGFFDLLHAGHAHRTIDFGADLAELRRLIGSADLVLEASRPRALMQLGIVAEELVNTGVSWVSITAQGRPSDAVGYGDDVAASAGLVLPDDGGLIPVADALADPLAGVAAALAAADALASGEARLIDLSMLHVAAEAAGPVAPHEVLRHHDQWWVEHDGGATPVEEPHLR
jgi:hypothetical protein